MAIVYANIGSNLGNKRALIEKALDFIGEYFSFYCISRFVESEPWGFDSTNFFLNIGVAFKTELPPEEVLDTLQQIEKKISSASHRDSSGKYIDREIDIDIMAIDELVYDTPRLKIPHPHLKERDFFLIPLKELISDEWNFPL